MYYYSHHIGDFDLATRHLSRLERSIYRDLIEVYYETETQLTLDLPSLCRRIIARSTDEVTAVEQVLNEFFTKTPSGWYQSRCEDELDKYRLSTSQKSVAGKASAAKREAKRLQALNGNPTDVQHAFNGTPTNHKPLTNNHKPVTNKEQVKRATRLPADWHPSQEDIDYCKKERPDLQASTVAENFRDYWIAKSGSQASKLDWSATWRSWVRKESAPRAGQKQQFVNGLGEAGQKTAQAAKEWLEKRNASR